MELEKTFLVHAYYAKMNKRTIPTEISYIPNGMHKQILKAFALDLNTIDPMDFKYFYENPPEQCNFSYSDDLFVYIS